MSAPAEGGVVRPASKEDLDSLLAIQALWPPLPRWTRRHFEEELAVRRSGLLVFEGEGRLWAYGVVRWTAPEAEVLAIAVHPDRLRRGLGRKILARLHSLAVEAGCSVCGLEVSAANRSAIALYSSAGYRVVGTRPNYYNDRSDALLMSRRLP